MTGTERNLLAIEKSKQPRTLWHIKNTPVELTHMTKASLTKNIFNAWLLQFDRGDDKQKKVLIFLDNCYSHMKPP